MNIKIGFWKHDTGNMLNHGKGLTPDQVEMLQMLKAGDRLILWQNIKQNEHTPDYTLAKYQKGD